MTPLLFLFRITADHRQKLFGAFGSLFIGETRARHMSFEVLGDDFIQKTVYRTPDGGHEMENFGATRIFMKRAFYSAYLASNSPDTRQQVRVGA
jgi:hypothetical protein